MAQMIITICATALLSSALTLGASYLLFQRKLKNDLRARFEELSVEAKERIKQGVIEAGMELLPKLRSEVREGFKEAVRDAVKPDVIEKTAKNMADIGSNLIENSLKALFGTKG